MIDYINIFIYVLLAINFTVVIVLLKNIHNVKELLFKEKLVNSKLREVESLQNINKHYELVNNRIVILFDDYFKSNLLTKLALNKYKLDGSEVNTLIIEVSGAVFKSFNETNKQLFMYSFNLKEENDFLRLIILKTSNYIMNLLVISKVKLDV